MAIFLSFFLFFIEYTPVKLIANGSESGAVRITQLLAHICQVYTIHPKLTIPGHSSYPLLIPNLMILNGKTHGPWYQGAGLCLH